MPRRRPRRRGLRPHRLDALWLAWQQLTDTEAGLTGASTWHRNHLDPTLSRLRAPDGPFGACTTNTNRPTHRLLATPATATEAADPLTARAQPRPQPAVAQMPEAAG
ncbi:DUF4913 domain-containing protein [Streptomyces sp. KK5PA1]|uniref:DUF4913 domain-containing protein n=1 Tax=Actinacidiphila acididurans TaxID=2784346 RepID=A0ABS2TX67_9ACTN|nr:DUF4913 domain-containing protein [Actinacidiphila acididurans]